VKHLILIFSLFLLSACGDKNPFKKDNPKKEPETPEEIRAAVEAKYDLYLALSEEKVKSLPFQWPDASGDGFLWACLYRYAGGSSDFTKAIMPSGKPLRNPLISPSQSATPWSKDMEIGFLYCLLSVDKDQANSILQKHIQYASQSNWDMCGPSPEYKISTADRLGRCVLSGTLKASLFRLSKYLGGSCDTACEAEILNPLNVDIPVEGEDFGRHLGVLHRNFRGTINPNGINDLQVNTLKSAAESEPSNALYQCIKARYTSGDTTEAAKLLLDASHFPEESLPTKANHCTDYLYQRDEKKERFYQADEFGCINFADAGSKETVIECDLQPAQFYKRYSYNPDWLPCEPLQQEHVPVDFLFAAKCILGK